MSERSGVLSVIIPVYNEKRTLAEIINRVARVPLVSEMIVVDDGSSDGSLEIAKDLEKKHANLRLIQCRKNKGKGSAIRTGLDNVRGRFVIIQDADLEYNPDEYPKLIDPLLKNGAEVVYGTRYHRMRKTRFIWHWFVNRYLGGHYEIRYLHHFIGILVLNLLANVLYSAKLTDEATCYKVFRSSLLKEMKLKSKGFEFCPEVTAKVRKRGIKIHEVPISYHPRPKSEGKKLNWTHGFQAIWTLIKYRFVD